MPRSYFFADERFSHKLQVFLMQLQIWDTPYEILSRKPGGAQDHVDIATVPCLP